MKKYGIQDEWNGLIKEYNELSKAEKGYEDHKNDRMGEGVQYDSYVELVETEDDFENEKVLKRATVEEDKELLKEIGTPEENGFEYTYWAKWIEQ